MAKYRIHAALTTEINAGNVWTYCDFKGNRLIKITNNNDVRAKVVIASYKHIEPNFEKSYNNRTYVYKINEQQSSLVIEEYYRNRLGIKTQEYADLTITPLKRYSYYNLKYLYDHPNDSIRITFWLATVSIFTGLFPVIQWIFRALTKLVCIIHNNM